MADNDSLYSTITKGIEEGETLPVIVKDRDGNINKEKTERINSNNRIFNAAQQNSGFTLGRLANLIGKLVGSRDQASAIRAAERAPKMMRGGMKKKRSANIDYRKGGMKKKKKSSKPKTKWLFGFKK